MARTFPSSPQTCWWELVPSVVPESKILAEAPSFQTNFRGMISRLGGVFTRRLGNSRVSVGAQQLRKMGGHGHGHGHGPAKPAGPYDLPHGPAYPEEAYPFGLSPDRKSEGWEVITWATYALCFCALVFGMNAKSNDSFTDWARREALAREQVKENGGEIKFGTYYQNAEYENDEVDTTPKLVDKAA